MAIATPTIMRRSVLQERKSISETRASELKALEAESSPETGSGTLTVSADIGASLADWETPV
jgi:hypothetical protein